MALVGSCGVHDKDQEKFFEALEMGIFRFKAYKEIGEKSRPSAVRENLNGARRLAERLYVSLQSLDGNSRQRLDQAQEGGTRSLQAATANTISALDSAIQLANEYPRAGRLPEPHRIFLAADVADAIGTHLGVKPTATKEGLFSAILGAVLTEATGKKSEAVHELARTALSYDVKLKYADGTVEYFPPNHN